MNGKSLNITEEKIEKLKAIVPEAFLKKIKSIGKKR